MAILSPSRRSELPRGPVVISNLVHASINSIDSHGKIIQIKQVIGEFNHVLVGAAEGALILPTSFFT